MILKIVPILNRLGKKEKSRRVWAFALVILMATSELAGIASILPFLRVISDPTSLNQGVLLEMRDFFGLESPSEATIFLGVVTLALILLSSLARIASTFGQNYIIQLYAQDVSSKVLSQILSKPMSYFKEKAPSELSSSVFGVSMQAVNVSIRPLLRLASSTGICIFISALLIFINPLAALVVGITLISTYMITYLLLQSFLGNLGRDMLSAQILRNKTVMHLFTGIKFIKIRGMENKHLETFDKLTHTFARSQALTSTFGQIPRYVIEAIAFCALIGYAISLFAFDVDPQTRADALPLVGAYALAGYRLLPATQVCFQSLVELRSGSPSVDHILSILKDDNHGIEVNGPRTPALQLNHTIELRAISYKYPSANENSIKKMSFDIDVGRITGIIGETGAGKSTLVDILLGLVLPSSGEVVVDDTRLDSQTIGRWQNMLGYVPQDIFLFDGSVRQNVAFTESDDIDDSAVQDALRRASLLDFVEASLPKGLDTIVGENGARLSGGQRQRIGIARALYHKPKVVVFDEATSALDSDTERKILETLNDGTTVIMITHRVSSLQTAHKIVVLDAGEVTAVGTYDYLMEQNDVFRRLAL